MNGRATNNSLPNNPHDFPTSRRVVSAAVGGEARSSSASHLAGGDAARMRGER